MSFNPVNYVVSGNAVEWYFRNQDNNYKSHCCNSFTRLLCKNWGSVAGGSFLNAFFIIFDSISDLFRVFILSFSVTQEVHVETAPISIKIVVVAITFSNW